MKRILNYQKSLGLFTLGLLSLVCFDSCLMVVLFTGPPSANTGELISTQLRLKSDSNLSEGDPIAAHIYLSLDPTFDPEDQKLSTAISFSALETDGYLNFLHSFTIPSDLGSGQYYLLAIVSENPENNPAQTRIYDNGQNIYQHTIQITGQVNDSPDLTLTNVHIGSFGNNYYDQDIYYENSTPRFFLTVENRGEAASGPVRLRWYFSDDDTFSGTDDVFAGETNVAGVAPHDRFEVSERLAFDNAFYGQYNYIFFFIDADYAESEWSELNNLVYRRILVRENRPDYHVSDFHTPGLAQAGTSINISGFVSGISSGTIPNLGFYISTEENIDAGDELFYVTPAYADGIFNTSIPLPSDIPTGSYYIQAHINHQQDIAEYNYSNNYDAIRLFIIGSSLQSDPCEEVIIGLESNEVGTTNEEKRTLSKTTVAKLHPFELRLYPNPATERITTEMTIEKDAQALQIQLLDVSGKVLHQVQINDPEPGQHQKNMDISRLPAGTYILHISDGKRVQTKQFVVK